MDCDFCKYAEDCHGPKDCVYPEGKSETGSRGQKPKDITVNEAKKLGILSKCIKCRNYPHCCGELAYIALDCLYDSKEEMRKEIYEI